MIGEIIWGFQKQSQGREGIKRGLKPATTRFATTFMASCNSPPPEEGCLRIKKMLRSNLMKRRRGGQKRFWPPRPLLSKDAFGDISW